MTVHKILKNSLQLYPYAEELKIIFSRLRKMQDILHMGYTKNNRIPRPFLTSIIHRWSNIFEYGWDK